MEEVFEEDSHFHMLSSANGMLSILQALGLQMSSIFQQINYNFWITEAPLE